MSLVIENFKVKWLGTKPPVNGRIGCKLHVSYDLRITKPILALRDDAYLDDKWYGYEFPSPQYMEPGVGREDYIEERFLAPDFNLSGHTYGRLYTYRDPETGQQHGVAGSAKFFTTMETAVPIVGGLGVLALIAYILSRV